MPSILDKIYSPYVISYIYSSLCIVLNSLSWVLVTCNRVSIKTGQQIANWYQLEKNCSNWSVQGFFLKMS